jgi:putative hydrolase of the HAD superfamily
VIKAVVFDLDGTLLDRDKSVLRFIDNQYIRLNKRLGNIPKESYCSRFIEYDKRGYVWKDQVYKQLIEEFKIEKFTWKELLQDYMSHFKHHCVAFSNLIETLQALQDRPIRLGIITNGYGTLQMDNIKALGIEQYFDTILVSEWEGIKKPYPEIFRKALTQLGVAAEESIYVGDHPVNDVKGSMDTGMVGVWKKDVHWEKVLADYIITDLHELIDLVDSLNMEKRRDV